MKTMYGKLLESLLVILLLMGNLPMWGQDATTAEESYFTVSGVVKNEQNKKKLGFVNISIPGTTVGTVTNEDGEFTLKVKNSLKAKEVSVSHLGYANSVIALNGTDMSDVTIWMKPYKYLLQEVVVLHHLPPAQLIQQGDVLLRLQRGYAAATRHAVLSGQLAHGRAPMDDGL